MEETPNIVASTDELLNKAFQLAYLIVGDRMAAVRIALAAMDNLKVASSVQDKRNSYMPTGGPASRAARTKVSLSKTHILQRLVYVESEIYERLRERPDGSERQEDLIISYIKHLVRVATKRNSFYVSLGLGRLLYDYTTSEAMQIYNLVVQDPDRMRDDYYYRSRRRRLMNELQQRFGNLVKVYRTNRREERFHANDESQKYAGLVKECLLRFTPWFTTCVLPAELEPTTTLISSLLFKGGHPDEEHAIEINRIHTLIHPDCYRRIASALGLDAPDLRLQLPLFFISGGDEGPMDDRFNPSELTEQELNAIKGSLDSKSRQRRRGSGGSLRVYVDGVERAYLELARTGRIQLRIGEDSEVVQVRVQDAEQDFIVATHLLVHDESKIVASQSATVAEAGQKISFSISSDSSDEASGALVKIEYEETRLARATSLWLRRMRYRATAGESERSTSLIPVFTFLAILACLAGLFIYLQSRTSKSRQPEVSEQTEERPAQSPSEQSNSQQPREPATTDRSGSQQPGQIASVPKPDQSTGGETTRGPQTKTNAAVLLSVKKVYVESLGASAASTQATQNLIDSFRTSGRFIMVQNREEADAVLKGTATASRTNPRKVSMSLRLVNIDGQVVWPTKGSTYRYEGDAERAGIKLLQDLLSDVQLLERRR